MILVIIIKVTEQGKGSNVKKNILAIAVIAAFSLQGCFKPSLEEQLLSAQNSIAQGDVAAAAVELKALLTDSPNNAEARFLLGQVYASRGAAVSAIKELEIALRLGFDKSTVLEQLVPMLYLQNEAQRIADYVAEVGSLTAKAASTVLVYDALASLDVARLDRAEERLAQLQQQYPNTFEVGLLEAYVLVAKNDLDEGWRRTEALLANYPQAPQALFLAAQLSSVSQRPDDAVNYYEQYRKQYSEDYRGAVFLANAYVKAQRIDEAEPLVKQLLRINAEQPFVNYLQSVILFKSEKYNDAYATATKAIQNGYGDSSARLLAGLSAFQIGNREQAYSHLISIKDVVMQDPGLARLLGTLSLNLGYPDAVVDMFSTRDVLSNSEVQLLSEAGSGMIRSGDILKARALADRIGGAELSEASALIARGQMRMSLKELEGVTDLEKALSLAPDSELANTSLARAYLDNNMIDEALRLAKTWQTELADKPNGFVLEAMAYIKAGAVDKAEKAYLQALQRDAANPAANEYFADKAFALKEVEQAVTYLEATLNTYPDYAPGLVKIFALLRDQGKVDIGLEWIEKARRKQSALNPALELMYATALYQANRKKDVIRVLSALDGVQQPDLYWVLLGDSYYHSGQRAESIQSAKDWTKKQPLNPVAMYRLITLLELEGQPKEALQEARVGLARFKDSLFGLLVTDLAVKTGDSVLAKKTLNELDTNSLNSMLGKQVHGQVLMAEGKASQALPLLQASYAETPSDRGAWLITKALVELKDYSRAQKFYRDHLPLKHADAQQLAQLAELAIRNSQPVDAIEFYKSSVAKGNADIAVINNLAYLLMQEGQAEAALEFSVMAYQRAPTNRNILDTHAMVLWKAGRLDESIQVFDTLFALDPTNVEVIKKYANVLDENGDRERASQLRKML